MTNKTIIERSVHHYTFTVPDMSHIKGMRSNEHATKKRKVKENHKCKYQGTCKIWKIDETSCSNCSGFCAEDWWEDPHKDY